MVTGLLKTRLGRGMLRWLHSRVRFVYTARSGLIRGLRRRGGFGFIPKRPLTHEEAWLAQQDWEGKVIYDVGAYQGIFTMFFARAVGPAGHVIAFEPNPHSASLLREHIALNGFSNVKVFEVALGETERIAGLSAPGGYAEMSRLTNTDGGLKVAVYSLDTLLEEQGLPLPSFIKVDVEGEEEAVLLGAHSIMSVQRPTLLVEVHPRASHESLWRLLKAHRYQLYNVEAQQEISAAECMNKNINWHLLALPEQNC